MNRAQAICGPTSPAFFVGKREILDWINATLNLSPGLQKIEQTSDGIVWCQICNFVWPDVPLGRVRIKILSDNDKIHNFKFLQSILNAKKIPIICPIERLLTGKFQDNLTFAQLMKFHFSPLTLTGNTHTPIPRQQTLQHPSPKSDSVQIPDVEVSALQTKISELELRISELTRTKIDLIQERDESDNEKIFYYDKLISIEQFINSPKFVSIAPEIVNGINSILASSGEAN